MALFGENGQIFCTLDPKEITAGNKCQASVRYQNFESIIPFSQIISFSPFSSHGAFSLLGIMDMHMDDGTKWHSRNQSLRMSYFLFGAKFIIISFNISPL